MPRKKKKGMCVFCLKKSSGLTREHVFPKAWYSDSTPPNVQRWTVPSCHWCNQQFSKIEDDLLMRLGMCANPSEYASIGIGKRVLDSVNPNAADTAKEKKARQVKRDKLIKQISPMNEIPANSILPDFPPLIFGPTDKYKGISIPPKSLKKIGTKIARGITYYFHKTYIDADHEIDVDFSNSPASDMVKSLIEQYGRTECCGPAIRVGVAYANDNPQCGLFDILIWGRLEIYVTVTPKERKRGEK